MAKGADEVLNQFTQAVEADKVDTSRRMKVGIIGTGWIAESHIQSYKNMPDVDVVAAQLFAVMVDAFVADIST